MNYHIPANKTRFIYSGERSIFLVITANPIYYEKLIYYNLVRKETVRKSIDCMNNKNSTIQEKNHNLFMIGFEVGANLLNKIIVLKPNIQDIVNYYVKSYFTQNYVIGLQMRFFRNENSFRNSKFSFFNNPNFFL